MISTFDLPTDYRKASSRYRQLIREEYIRRQEGLCSHCSLPLDGEPAQRVMDSYIMIELFPPGFFIHPIHLHHSHQTGMTIGAVHARCNAYLWQHKGE